MERRADDPSTLTLAPLSLDEPLRRGGLRRIPQERRYGRLLADQIAAFHPQAVLSANSPLDVQAAASSAAHATGAASVFWLQDLHSVAITRITGRRFPILGSIMGTRFRRLEQRLLRESDGVVAVSAAFLPVVADWGVALDRVAVIENWARVGPRHVGPGAITTQSTKTGGMVADADSEARAICPPILYRMRSLPDHLASYRFAWRRDGRDSLAWSQLLALAICIGFGLAFAIANIRSWELEDAEAYWNAAIRLREGGSLYVGVDPAADETLAYRYSPWLAWLWLPLTLLPKILVQVGWSALLVAATVVALAPLVRLRTVAAICLAALLGGLLVRTASTGNVHALLIAALVYGAPRRSGPLWIGLAASLKFAPIGYVLVYAGRRQWARAALAVTVAAVLLAPALLYDLANYPAEAGDSLSLLSNAGPVPWALVAIIIGVAALLLARTRFAWAAASVAALAAVPRLDLYSLTYLLVGLDAPGPRADRPAHLD